MKIFFAILAATFFVLEAESTPIVRGVAPNRATPGESITIRVVVENIPSLVTEDQITIGEGLRVLSIEKESFQNRLDRRLLFLQLEISIDASAEIGKRNVIVAGSSVSSASGFYVTEAPETTFHTFKQITSDLIPLHLLSENLDTDAFDELAAVYLSPFADGFVDVIHPFQNTSQRIYSQSEGHLVSAREAALADQNGDGFKDLSILNWLQFDVLGGVLVRHQNKGDGTFQSVSDRQSRIADLFITSGNFDRDRFEDIALIGYLGEILVISGTGKQTRVSTVPKNFRGEVHGIVASDVNGDGQDDLVVAVDNEADDKKEFRIAISNRDGSFQRVKRISVPYAEEDPWVHAISDLNNDGNKEFVFTNDHHLSLIVATYLNGTLTNYRSFRVECNALAVEDIDSDGDTDIACVGNDIDQAALFRTSGSSFLPRITLDTPKYPVSIAIGDWNSDRKFDLAIGFGKLYFPHLPNERNGLTFLLQN
ncbi:MAG TPA: VCBS repeat-containing protein [Acidobacteriota bacterium]|nr:VCBS repeat-containing protein [Acidobacteriota bacterium]